MKKAKPKARPEAKPKARSEIESGNRSGQNFESESEHKEQDENKLKEARPEAKPKARSEIESGNEWGQNSLDDFIDNEKFIKFLQTSGKSNTPILKKSNAVQEQFLETPNLEQEVGFVQNTEEKKVKKENSFEYNLGVNQGEDSKYISSYNMVEGPQHTNISNLGKGKIFQHNEIGFTNSQEAQSNFIYQEKLGIVKKIETNKLGKESLFKNKEIKYRPSTNQ